MELQTRPQPPSTPPLSKTTFKLQPITLGRLDPVDPSKLNLVMQTTDPPLTPTPGAQNTRQTAPPRPVQRIMGGPGTNFPNTDDYYPAASRRMAETGAAMVRVCVNTQGRLTADPTIAASSGSRRIDDGALNLAKAGSGHYRPTLEDGEAVNACFAYRIRFMLIN
ncbi:MAG TPA: TonB family protein [Steroidobacteraceae bacterium]